MNTIGQDNRFEVRDEQGFDVHVLANEKVELAVVPQLGARIISLKNIRTQHEWMWHPPGGLKLFRNRVGDDFAGSPLAGLDECLPTIAPCAWQGRQLPDHGEVWSVPWQVDATLWETGILRTFVRLKISPLKFERTIELRDNEVLLSYRLDNVGKEDECYLWAMHPLLGLREGCQLALPSPTRAQLNGAKWIDALDTIAEGDSAKLFAQPVEIGRAGVFHRHSGERLEFIWNPSENDTLGLWLTRGGWHGHHHLAVEPTNASCDTLSAAAETGRCGWVRTGDFTTWEVRLRING